MSNAFVKGNTNTDLNTNFKSINFNTGIMTKKFVFISKNIIRAAGWLR